MDSVIAESWNKDAEQIAADARTKNQTEQPKKTQRKASAKQMLSGALQNSAANFNAGIAQQQEDAQEKQTGFSRHLKK